MDRRRYLTVTATASLTAAGVLAGCVGSDDSGDEENDDSQPDVGEYDAESLEPEASVPIDEHNRGTETGIEQLLITESVGDHSPAEHTVALDHLVQNSAPERRTAVLVSTLDVRDGESYEERRAISVPGDTVNEYVVAHEIEESTSADGFEYSFSASLDR